METDVEPEATLEIKLLNHCLFTEYTTGMIIAVNWRKNAYTGSV